MPWAGMGRAIGAGEREFGHEGGEKVRGSGAGGGEPRFQRVFQGHQLVHLEQDPAFLGEGWSAMQ